MKIAVLKETAEGETRCAAIPETVKKFAALGAEVAVERGAGTLASVSDAEFEAAGAKVGSRAETLKSAGIILCVTGPDLEAIKGAEKGALLVGSLDPARRGEAVKGYAAAGLDAFAMEWMPRITRAQSMDVLSSQSNLAGYKAVIDAAAIYGRAYPMMMTAAGTISPAKVFVMGVGVAGLQAIATAKRLGAQVSATDVRSATKEQIQSLGAKPIFVENVAGIEGEGAGGYATEMSAEYQKAQADLVSGHIAKQDIVVTTALIPGKPAPRLISDAQVASMRPGSVIVDMAADAGGNVEGTVAGERTVKHGVTIIGASNLARTLAADSSALFARNLYNFLSAFWDKDEGGPVLPDDDEIVKGTQLTKGGKLVHERLTQ
ncbi:MAG TPA: Re/Si-specific NAD(P)(+) transhydrogenase subunit alpha [Sphingomicrobium sp.]|jgi:NAD(P) transhydrogenase subunit alpha|nr:Re/Si-specific NAD(P)(+) transhydrogenase subunit alpha [Sphingomicrobium sp.]